MSSKIQQINSCPDYISKFIQLNMEQLFKIYDEGMKLNSDLDKGILCFLCSEKASFITAETIIIDGGQTSS